MDCLGAWVRGRWKRITKERSEDLHVEGLPEVEEFEGCSPWDELVADTLEFLESDDVDEVEERLRVMWEKGLLGL